FFEVRDQIGAFRDCCAGAFQRVVDGFEAAAQDLRDEGLANSAECLPVLRTGKAVAFVGEEDVNNRDVLTFHCRDDLIAFSLLDARVVSALPNKEGILDQIDVVQRRGCFEDGSSLLCTRVPYPACKLLKERSPIWRDA